MRGIRGVCLLVLVLMNASLTQGSTVNLFPRNQTLCPIHSVQVVLDDNPVAGGAKQIVINHKQWNMNETVAALNPSINSSFGSPDVCTKRPELTLYRLGSTADTWWYDCEDVICWSSMCGGFHVRLVGLIRLQGSDASVEPLVLDDSQATDGGTLDPGDVESSDGVEEELERVNKDSRDAVAPAAVVEESLLDGVQGVKARETEADRRSHFALRVSSPDTKRDTGTRAASMVCRSGKKGKKSRTGGLSVTRRRCSLLVEVKSRSI